MNGTDDDYAAYDKWQTKYRVIFNEKKVLDHQITALRNENEGLREALREIRELPSVEQDEASMIAKRALEK